MKRDAEHVCVAPLRAGAKDEDCDLFICKVSLAPAGTKGRGDISAADALCYTPGVRGRKDESLDSREVAAVTPPGAGTEE